MRHNWPSVGWNLGIDGDGDDEFYTSNPSYRMIMPITGSDAGILQLKGTATGTAGEKRTTVPEVVHAAFSPDSNFRLNGILNTDTFSSDWASSANSGTYLANALVVYNGTIYKNITGANTNTPPDTDNINWSTTGSSLWENDSVNTRIQLKRLSTGAIRPTNNGVFIKDNGNVGVGTNNPGAPLDVAGRIWQTSTGNSVFLGTGAGANDDLTTNNNVFVGYQTGAANSGGADNTAVGYQALNTITTANNITAIGSLALANNSSSNNTAMGYEALTTNTSGVNNTAMGYQSLFRNTGGDRNVAVGYYTLANVTTGNDNIGIGDQAGDNTTTGSNNISIGNGAQPEFRTTSNQVTIGNGSNNSFRINGTWTNASDRRLKKEINYTVPGLRLINKLKPADFLYLNTTNGKKDVGFIAQDVAQVMEEEGYDHVNIVQLLDGEAGTLGVKYTSFISILTQAVQELDAALKKSQQALQEQQAAFDLKLAQQQKEIDALKALIKGNYYSFL